VSAPGASASLAPFYRGAFSIALACGAPVWALVQRGTDVAAPADVSVGGFPAVISSALVKLYDGTTQEGLTEDALAEACRAAMQAQLDALAAQDAGAQPQAQRRSSERTCAPAALDAAPLLTPRAARRADATSSEDDTPV
jgi:hypothetical protein